MPSSSSTRVRRALALAILLTGSASGPDPSGAEPEASYRGRLLVEVLQEFRVEHGLELIFSTAVVGEGLRVTVEPSATTPREILEQILEPLGLAARDGPAGSILILARPVGGLRGRVVVKGRRSPIAGASIHVEDAGREVSSASDGSFELPDLARGVYRVTVRATGFEPLALEHVRVTGEAPAELLVELRLQSVLLTEVVVTPGTHSVLHEGQAARSTLAREDTVLVPTIGGDISRVVALLPGVAAPDNSAALNVRGSLAQDVSLVLDGLELYDPFHMRDFQSPFTLIDSKIIDRIDLFKGGFGVEMGDRHGGFAQIETAAPGDAAAGAVEAGTLNSGAFYRGPLPGGAGSWLVSVRGWYPDAVRNSINFGGGEELDPRFGDAYGKVTLAVSPRTLLTVHGLASRDRLDFEEAGVPADEVGESASARTRNQYLWFRVLNAWSAAVTSETTLSGGQIDRERSGRSVPQEDVSIVADDRVVRFLGLRHDTAWSLSPAQALKAGFDARELSARYRYALLPLGDPDDATAIALDPDGTSLGVYVAHRARLAPGLTTEVGLRWDRQDYTNDNQLGPRLNVLWKVGRDSELRLGLGTFSQSQRIHELDVQDGETEFQPAEVSHQAELTFQRRSARGPRYRLDAYYRKLPTPRTRHENLFQPIELFPESGDDRVEIAPLRARLRGIEALASGSEDRPFVWWASYAFSAADDVIEGEGSVPRSWDQTHAVKFLVGRSVGERWTVSLAGTAHTGWPTTPVVAPAEPDGSETIEELLGPRNSERFATYFRLDAKVKRSFAIGRGRLALTLDVVNLTDRDNPCCVDEFTFESGPDGSTVVRRELDYWLGFTPSFSLLWEF